MENASVSWPVEESPFVIQGPLPPDRVLGREREIASLIASARAGTSVVLSAPRRFGKTSLLGAVARRLVRDHDTAAVVVDLFGAQSLADVTVRIERAYSRGLQGPVRGLVERVMRSTGLGLSLSAFGIGVVFQRSPRADPLPALHALLDLPTRLAPEVGRSWVVFDEFQSLAHLVGVDGLIRSHVQHHRDVASYVFAGSEAALLRHLFDDPARPFYAQAEPRRLDRLSNEVLGEVITDGFARTERGTGETLAPLLSLAEGHPQRAMLLAHLLWGATPHGQVAGDEQWSAARQRALDRVSDESEARFVARSPNQRKVLRAVAEWRTPYAKDAQAQLDLAQGSVSSTVAALVRTGDLEQRGGGWRFVDPLYERWLQRRFALGPGDA